MVYYKLYMLYIYITFTLLLRNFTVLMKYFLSRTVFRIDCRTCNCFDELFQGSSLFNPIRHRMEVSRFR